MVKDAAVAEDPTTASLLQGINTDRFIVLTFFISSFSLAGGDFGSV